MNKLNHYMHEAKTLARHKWARHWPWAHARMLQRELNDWVRWCEEAEMELVATRASSEYWHEQARSNKGWRNVRRRLQKELVEQDPYERGIVYVDRESYDAFVADLERPPEVNEKLRALFRKYKD